MFSRGPRALVGEFRTKLFEETWCGETEREHGLFVEILKRICYNTSVIVGMINL